MDSTKIASDISYTIKDLKRDGLDVSKLTKDVLVEIFGLVNDDVISAAETEVIIKDACNGIKPMDSVKNNNLEKLSDEAVEAGIQEIIDRNRDMIEERKMAAMGPLMGQAMGKFKGKADGKLVSDLVKKAIMSIVNN